ncbi:MAG TPA: hypothetical protein VK184_12280 [Nostocaceae cyanobacterium]|nr:hypothetical protein [Nostocaceae cyanobacterium]
MNDLLYSAWEGNPPEVYYIAQPMPNSPNLNLTGGGTAIMSLEHYLLDLESDIKKQKGHYYAFVSGFYNSQDEADIYTLTTWQVCYPNDGTYEAVVILYYSALNPYLTIRKHYGEEASQEYLARNAAITAISNAFT